MDTTASTPQQQYADMLRHPTVPGLDAYGNPLPSSKTFAQECSTAATDPGQGSDVRGYGAFCAAARNSSTSNSPLVNSWGRLQETCTESFSNCFNLAYDYEQLEGRIGSLSDDELQGVANGSLNALFANRENSDLDTLYTAAATGHDGRLWSLDSVAGYSAYTCNYAAAAVDAGCTDPVIDSASKGKISTLPSDWMLNGQGQEPELTTAHLQQLAQQELSRRAQRDANPSKPYDRNGAHSKCGGETGVKCVGL